MTQLEITFDETILHVVLLGDRGAEVLLEKVMSEILQAEMTEHLGAEPGEQVDVLPVFSLPSRRLENEAQRSSTERSETLPDSNRRRS
ncbi:transposase [Salinibacter ruber]|uniref:transposase n=1 Tax=Salinibacter ruber TaxID=146919 RepID=UPI00216A5DA1|nr:transposase [Salinibacter ruber]